MSWFCSRVISFSSVLLVMTLATSTGHLDVIKYLSSPGASWEGRDLGRSHSFSGLQGEDKVLLVPGDWWCWNGSASSLHFAGKAASSQMWAGFFYPHVNPALIHSWILWAKQGCCLMETLLPKRIMAMAWDQKRGELCNSDWRIKQGIKPC